MANVFSVVEADSSAHLELKLCLRCLVFYLCSVCVSTAGAEVCGLVLGAV